MPKPRVQAMRFTTTLLLVMLVLAGSNGIAFAGRYHREGNLIGASTFYNVSSSVSLFEVAKEYDIGVNAISAANPAVDPFIPESGTHLVIPTQWILPDVPIRQGIVINIAEMRLYYFPRDNARDVVTFPIGIGDQGMQTPEGVFRVVEKIKNPPWYVPKSILNEKPYLPPVVPPGPDNPMGSRALRLSNRSILIHGTDRPWGIGTRSSHGCIRLYENDIHFLFDIVKLGTRVVIVNQAVKVAVIHDEVFLQVSDYEDQRDLFREAFYLLDDKNLLEKVDLFKVRAAALEASGVLVNVSLGSPPPKPRPLPRPQPKTEPESQPQAAPQPQPPPAPKTQPQAAPQAQPQGEPQPQAQPQPQTQAPQQAPQQIQPHRQPETKPQAPAETKPEGQKENKPQSPPQIQPESQPQLQPQLEIPLLDLPVDLLH